MKSKAKTKVKTKVKTMAYGRLYYTENGILKRQSKLYTVKSGRISTRIGLTKPYPQYLAVGNKVFRRDDIKSEWELDEEFQLKACCMRGSRPVDHKGLVNYVLYNDNGIVMDGTGRNATTVRHYFTENKHNTDDGSTLIVMRDSCIDSTSVFKNGSWQKL